MLDRNNNCDDGAVLWCTGLLDDVGGCLMGVTIYEWNWVYLRLYYFTNFLNFAPIQDQLTFSLIDFLIFYFI